jgi:acetylornithine deacetylase/succinyl-diaminopimelate desuccinylase-like protein
MTPALLDDLNELLRIPSVSAGRPNHEAVRQAAEWVKARVERAGGEAELVGDPYPIVVGELHASRPEAPDVLVYGHYDVQDVGPRDEWLSDPFEPQVRDGRLYARGASDDKGNFLPVLHAACELHAAGRLPVNVRVLIEGEEERTSGGVVEWIRADARGADAAIVFDAAMASPDRPAITTACRGYVQMSLTVRVAAGDLHSGLYGGTKPNAIHALDRILAAVIPGDDFRPREELRAGIAPPSAAELESWRQLPPSPEFHERTGADASLEVNGVISGATEELRTIIPAVARANLSLRTAPGQKSAALGETMEALLREAAPAYAELDVWKHTADPALFDPDSPPLLLARAAFERATGVAPALVRSGGTIPILAALSERGIQTIVSGFALPEDAIHAPNESYRLTSLELNEKTSFALLEELGRLPSGRRAT